MAQSGIGVDDEVIDVFQKMKQKKTYKYALFRINDKLDKIVVEKLGDKDATYEQFVQELGPDQPIYAIFDFDYINKDGVRNQKLFFVNWCPEGAKVKPKMIHSSSKDALKNKLVGFAHELQATDQDEISTECFMEKLNKK